MSCNQNPLEKTMGILFYLADGKWIDEKTLFRRFGEDVVSYLYKTGAITRRWHDSSIWSDHQYAITEYGKSLLSLK